MMGEKDCPTRAMVPDSHEKYELQVITDQVEGILHTLFLKHRMGMKSQGVLGILDGMSQQKIFNFLAKIQ